MKRGCCRHPRASRGFGAIIEIAVVAVLILLGVSLYLGFMKDSAGLGLDAAKQVAPGEPTTVPGRAVHKAQDEKCREQLRQIRQLISVAQMDTPGQNPPGLPPEAASINRCPVGNEPYQYDPATGRVRCVHPGHEQFSDGEGAGSAPAGGGDTGVPPINVPVTPGPF